MRRLAVTLAALAGLAAAAPAAPAAPRATDFSQAVELGGAGAARAAGGTVVSAPLRARGRFDLVGLTWRDRRALDVRLRAHTPGEGWSRWVQAEGADAPGATEPVWTGGADRLQVRLSRRPAGLRASFVRTSGRARPRARAAQSGAPAIVPRDAWGAAGCAPRDAPTYGRVDLGVVHHTVTTNAYGPADSAAMVLAICRYHRNTLGWDDIGYNFLVDRYGQVFEGRAGGVEQPVMGAQMQGFNHLSTGVANLGDHSVVPQTDVALRAVARLLAWKLTLHGTPVAGAVQVVSGGGSANRFPAGATVTLPRIAGHRDGGLTACPGDALYAQLPALRDAALAEAATLPVLGPVPPPTSSAPATPAGGRLTLETAAETVAWGQPAQVGGRLSGPDGRPLAGARVAVEVQGTAGFRSVTQTTTSDDGGWSTGVSTSTTRTLRAQAYRGALRVATSPTLRVQVVPRITMRAARRVTFGRAFTLTGTVRPIKRRLVLEIARQGRDRVLHRVARVAVRVDARGRFAHRLRLRRPALHRLRLRFAGDAQNPAAAARDVMVRAVRR